MNAEQKPVQDAINWYVDEIKKEGGWHEVIEAVSLETKWSRIEILLLWIYKQQVTLSMNQTQIAELHPYLLKSLKQMAKEIDEDESWKEEE